MLSELVEGDLSHAGKDAVYEMADTLLEHKSSIESALRAQEMRLFLQVARVCLYDLTNIYMEGAAESNTLVKYRRSKDERSDCRLITLALLVDEYGSPLFSHVYGENQSDPETIQDVLYRLEGENPDLLRGTVIFVMDRGTPRETTSPYCRIRGTPTCSSSAVQCTRRSSRHLRLHEKRLNALTTAPTRLTQCMRRKCRPQRAGHACCVSVKNVRIRIGAWTAWRSSDSCRTSRGCASW